MFENFFYTWPYTIQIYQRAICLSEHKASEISDSNSPQKLVKYKSNLWTSLQTTKMKSLWARILRGDSDHTSDKMMLKVFLYTPSGSSVLIFLSFNS